MNKNLIVKKIKIVIIFIFLLIPNLNKAEEILLYADSISYDENENIISKGNAKIFQKNKLFFSELIIYNKIEEKIILPSKFVFKDENNNYFEGENGFFINNLNFGEFDNPKIKLNDGSRIIGKKIKRDGDIDIITRESILHVTQELKLEVSYALLGN